MTTHSTTLEQLLRKSDLPAPNHGERVIWDHQIQGLGLRLRAKWRPVWIVQRRIDRRSIKQTIGPLADLRRAI